MNIGPIDLDKKVMVVAEIGNNHEGVFAVAERMVREAAACGADAVKFQAIVPEELVGPEQVERLAMLKRFQLTTEQFIRLSVLARELGLVFILTPFDLRSVDALAAHVDALKIASGDNTFYPLLEAVAETGKPIVISTGLLDLAGISALYDFMVAKMGRDVSGRLAFLHCVSAYPVPDNQAGLAALHTLRERVPCPIGYSDHTLGIEAAVQAVAAGARLIEKHFTFDKKYSNYRDHQLSADPADFRLLVDRIRRVEGMMGVPGKNLQPAERLLATGARRSIAARHDLPAGHMIAREDLSWLRPGGGLAPGEEAQLVGRRLRHPMKQGDRFTAGSVGEASAGSAQG